MVTARIALLVGALAAQSSTGNGTIPNNTDPTTNTTYSPAQIIDSNEYYVGGTPELRNGTYGTTNRSAITPDRLGVSYEAPDPITGLPYNQSLNTGKYTTSMYDNAQHTADASVLDKRDTYADESSPDGCSAKGMLCNFKDYTKLGDYDPMDFVWKVIVPDDYQKAGYQKRTLNCIVKVVENDGDTGKDFFYIPLGGEENQPGHWFGVQSNYCDVESIRREVNNAALNMTDTIQVRGETARLNNGDMSARDIIGEQFDVACTCTTTLSTSASVTADQAAGALLSVMNSTGQTRVMEITLKLYSDTLLTNEIVYQNQVFPKASQYFFFLIHQDNDEDWNLQLQINKCVACQASDATCTTKNTTANFETNYIVFYEKCAIVTGGPKLIPIGPSSWYHDPNNDNAEAQKFKIPNPSDPSDYIWSMDDKQKCPFHALGFQKFRLADSNLLKVTCAISACNARPCPPCTSRRRSLALPPPEKRMLQRGAGAPQDKDDKRPIQEDEADVSIFLKFFEDDRPVFGNINSNRNNNTTSSDRKKADPVFLLILLFIIAIVSGVMVYMVRNNIKKKEEKSKAQKINLEMGSASSGIADAITN